MAFIDARTLPNATEIEADLIIIGGGLAGLAIAKQWAGSGRRVAVLESGGREMETETQTLYAGAGLMRAPGAADKPIDEYLIQSRVRALGGSGNVWGGKCVPLDESDFTHRDWLDRTGWPITRAELNPFYDRACDLLQIERFNRDWDASPEPDRPPLRINDDFFSAPRRFSQVSGWADRPRFDAFCSEGMDDVSIYLYANVTNIRVRGSRVQGLDVACLNGHRHTAQACHYILATGGIENVRLLLASGGIGNHSDLLGRCFMGHVTFGVYEHPEGLNTMVCVSGGQSMSLYTSNGRDMTHCVLATTLEGQRRFGTGNFTTTLFDSRSTPPAEDAAIMTLASQLDASGAAPLRNSCFFMSEQLPNLESRITLLPEHTDPLGMPRVLLDWVYSERDMANLERSIAALGDALGADGKGRVRWPVERSQLIEILSTSRHHMGTTRMSPDADQGVVDEHCRVHGVRNLHIAGSSVFPTSGIANPTLTLIALAMRLSDHLKREMGVRA